MVLHKPLQFAQLRALISARVEAWQRPAAG
jgi:hypothetical protein